jgi:hypothetical protein
MKRERLMFDKYIAQEVLDSITPDYINLEDDIKKFIEESKETDVKTLDAINKKYGIEPYDIDFEDDMHYYYGNDFEMLGFTMALDLSTSIDFKGHYNFASEYIDYGGDSSDDSSCSFDEAVYEVVLGMLLEKFKDKIPDDYKVKK